MHYLPSVRPKIANREKQQGKHEKYPKKLGKQYVKHEETNGEMGETCRELPLGGFLSHLVTIFKPLHTLPNSPANDFRICLITKKYIAVHFFYSFLPQMLSYANFILIAIGGRSVAFLLSFHGGSAAHTKTLECHKMSIYLVYLVNSKTTSDCLTWIVLYKELRRVSRNFSGQRSFLKIRALRQIFNL